MDFSSLESGDVADAVETVAKGLLGHEVTSFCPTIVTSSPEYYSTVCLKRGEGDRGEKRAEREKGKAHYYRVAFWCVCLPQAYM